MGCSKSSSKREVYSNTSLPPETRKISNNLTLKKQEEEQSPMSVEEKNKIKIRVEINKRDIKENKNHQKQKHMEAKQYVTK